MSIDILALRQRLTEILQGELGNYITSNGATVPALHFVNPTAPFPTWKARGLEVVVTVPTNLSRDGMFKGARIVETISVALTQWDTAASTKSAAIKLIAAIASANCVFVPPTEDSYERCTITFPYYFYVR